MSHDHGPRRERRRARPDLDSNCTGAASCTARNHAHGCFADVDCSRCDDPQGPIDLYADVVALLDEGP